MLFRNRFNVNELFIRPSNDSNYLYFEKIISPKLNLNNIESIRRHQIKKMFSIKNEHNFLLYRFNLLHKWLKLNERYDAKFIFRLDNLLTNLYLNEYLNSYEQEYLIHVRAIVFAKTRNFKNLIVDFPKIDVNEQVFYKYEAVSLFSLNDKQKQTILNQGEFYISNQRIIIIKDLKIFSFLITEIVSFKLDSNGIVIKTANGHFLINNFDFYVIYVSIERMLKYINYKL